MDLDKFLQNLNKTSFRIHPIIDECIENYSIRNDIQKSEAIYKALSVLVPDKFSEVIGAEEYSLFLDEIKKAILESKFEREEDFAVFLKMMILLNDNTKVAINIFNLIYKEKTTIKKNNFTKLLCFKSTFIDEIKKDIISDSEIRDRYMKSLEKDLEKIQNNI